jgi:hypothetical protein
VARSEEVVKFGDRLAGHGGQLIVQVCQNVGDYAPRSCNALGESEAAIQQKAADLADDCGAVIDHSLPGAMQSLDIVLLDALLWDEGDMRLTRRCADRGQWSISLTSIARESMPRRKSTGHDATRIRRSDRRVSIAPPATRSTRFEALVHRRGLLREFECRQVRFRLRAHHSQCAVVRLSQAQSSQARMPVCFGQRLGPVRLPSLAGAIRTPSRIISSQAKWQVVVP